MWSTDQCGAAAGASVCYSLHPVSIKEKHIEDLKDTFDGGCAWD
jgi:hypothetical protein